MNDGGSAFPMALRDWFAGQALAGFAAKHAHGNCSTYASDAYKAADAMIAERAKGADDETSA